jgi:uncharacterized protein YndB with AHSA1/START domain
MDEGQVRATVTVDAPPEDVWDALTVPSEIKRWFFGVDTETDWKVGGPLVHRGQYQGRPYEDKGTVLEVDPPRRLVHSHWSPVSGTEDEPDNYQVVRWDLAPVAGRTRLTVTEDNLPSVEAERVSEQAWGSALGALRQLFEASA